MQATPVHILEVRADGDGQPVSVTAAVTADGSRTILTALSEQLDRRRVQPTLTAHDVMLLRAHVALVERFEPLATLGAHGVVGLSDADVRACLLELTDYVNRVDDEHFQPPELRERLRVIEQIIPVLWDANATAAAAAAERRLALLPGQTPHR